MKNKQETTLWKMLRRVSDRIIIKLNDHNLDEASAVETFSFKNIEIYLNKDNNTVSIKNGEVEQIVDYDLLLNQPSLVLRDVLEKCGGIKRLTQESIINNL